MAIVARRVTHNRSQDVPYLAVKEVQEGLLLSKAAGWVLGAEVVVEGRRSLLEATVRSSAVEQTAPVAEEERVEGWERLVVGPREVVVAPGLLRQLEVPLRRHLVVRPRSQIGWISAYRVGQPRQVQRKGASLVLCHGTYIPEVGPANEIRMVNLSLRVDMLSWPHDHGLGGSNVYERRLSWVCVRDPYRYGESVCGAAKVDWYCTGDMEEEGRAAIGECWCRERAKSV